MISEKALNMSGGVGEEAENPVLVCESGGKIHGLDP